MRACLRSHFMHANNQNCVRRLFFFVFRELFGAGQYGPGGGARWAIPSAAFLCPPTLIFGPVRYGLLTSTAGNNYCVMPRTELVCRLDATFHQRQAHGWGKMSHSETNYFYRSNMHLTAALCGMILFLLSW
jgi:hypothetical protein